MGMTIYGVSPLGGAGYGGAGLISVLGVLPLTNGSFVVVYDMEPKTDDSTSPTSAINVANYSLAAIDPTYISSSVPSPGILAPGLVAPTRTPLIVKAVQDKEDPTQVIVYTDCSLEGNIQYSVGISTQICGVNCEAFDGQEVWLFTAPLYPQEIQQNFQVLEKYRDLAWAPYDESGYDAFIIDNTNDIGIQSGRESLLKRIKRRVFSQKGGFAWAPNYGVGIKAKALVRGGEMQSLATLINQQILLEPDVVNSSTTVAMSRTTTGAFLEIGVDVLTRDSRVQSFQFRQPVP